jgi:hypothetical protein
MSSEAESFLGVRSAEPKAATWRAWIDGAEFSPYTVSELRTHRVQERITDETQIAPVGSEDWKPLLEHLPDLMNPKPQIPQDRLTHLAARLVANKWSVKGTIREMRPLNEPKTNYAKQMATQYDPAIIQKFADKLYSQANTIVSVWTFLGAVVGGACGHVLGNAAVGAVIIGALGFAIGMQRACLLRLQAQVALCQKQIEENTRR